MIETRFRPRPDRSRWRKLHPGRILALAL